MLYVYGTFPHPRRLVLTIPGTASLCLPLTADLADAILVAVMQDEAAFLAEIHTALERIVHAGSAAPAEVTPEELTP